jgi:hypothetical protein
VAPHQLIEYVARASEYSVLVLTEGSGAVLCGERGGTATKLID